MLVLFELGEARRIPERAARAMVEALNALPVKVFPIHPGDMPAGLDPYRHTSCHCVLGGIVHVLDACGLDVHRELPWAEPWFLRYQLADGGLTCDNDAYRVTGECPSSMVGTVPPLEAMLLGDPTTWSPARTAFVDRAAGFLIGRELHRGSSTVANAEERTSAPAWLQPCFPRLYFYDVVRGVQALVRWAERRHAVIPRSAVEVVVAHLAGAFPAGIVRLQRRSYEGVDTYALDPTGTRTRQPASPFSLLDATSAVGEPSPWVTRQWAETRAGLRRLIEAERLVEG